MRLIALLILSSISTAFLASCVQSDEEYFKQLKREGISQEQKNRQSSRSSYGLDEFQREKEEAARERWCGPFRHSYLSRA
jgi:hypothetical protein